MINERFQCIDAGSEYCPCYLAETMDCITCSHLKENEFCDCDWRGVCIFQEYHFSGCKMKGSRDTMVVPVTERKNIGSSMIIFTLKVPHTLARQLNQPGAYIFIRNKHMNHYFDMPMSVMHVDMNEDLIKLAVEIHGTKTKRIKETEDFLCIRGPYWNGLFGLKHLKQTKNENCLIVARGIAQAPAIPLIYHLLKNKNSVDVLIDEGSAKYNFIQEYCSNIRILGNNKLIEPEGTELVRSLIHSGVYKLVFLGASDFVLKKILSSINNLNEFKLITTNSHEMCCGEGICGSCTVFGVNGIPIRTCKTQIIDN